MANNDIYKQGLKVLNIARKNIQADRILTNYRDSVYAVFFDNNSLRREFVDILPAEKIAEINGFLKFLASIGATINDGTIMSNYGNMKKEQVLNGIAELESAISKEVNQKFGYKVFYSWQSDSDQKCNRNFIEDCLKQALKKINREISEDSVLGIDKDTIGVPGSPDIVNTILEKIDASECFVADITPVGQIGQKQIPNPNVMFELGYATSSLKSNRAILVCNTAHCNLGELPFDLGLKRIISYELDASTSGEDKAKCKAELISKLASALRGILGN